MIGYKFYDYKGSCRNVLGLWSDEQAIKHARYLSSYRVEDVCGNVVWRRVD
jgi:hypothetical protein